MNPHKLDHLIYFAPNLDEAFDYFEGLVGVRPQFGGQHPGRGSHNALLSLANGSYLEIIAPDPNQPAPPHPRSFGIDKLTTPRLVTWAVGTADIEQSWQNAQTAGYDPGPIMDGSRSRADGVLMAWRLTRRPEALAGDIPQGDWLIPFLIDWGQTPHPSNSNPAGCEFIEVKATHPDPEPVRKMLSAMNVTCAVEKGDVAQLFAVLDTPNGRVTLA